jgi:hypothetical protein
MHRLLLSIIIAIASLCASCVSDKQAQSPIRLLFVGNSLTYVGNLPAVLDALAASNKKSLQSDMIVKGGATLTERVADGSVERALAANPYDYVVLQERGGDTICAFGPTSCQDADASLSALAHIVAAHGAKPILLGTYQAMPQVSTELVGAESVAASRLSIAYVPVSDRFQTAIESAPAAEWLFADRAHPGHDLVLLEAALLYRQVFGALPSPGGFSVHAPMYGPNAKFSAPSPTSHSAASQDVAPLHIYTADRVATALAIAAGGSR